MRGQLLHLLQLLETRPDLTVQVVRSAPAPNDPLLGGCIIVLDFATAPRIGFVTSVYGPAVHHDAETGTRPLLRVFERVRELAMSPEAASHSSGASNACIEVRVTDMRVDVRDSKNRTAGKLTFDRAAWVAFLAEMRAPGSAGR